MRRFTMQYSSARQLNAWMPRSPLTRAAMAEASRVVLAGFELGTDVSATRWPDRYMDVRGKAMWERVQKLLSQINAARLSA